MHLQSCYFANLNLLLFLPFSLMSPSLLLKDQLGFLASWSSLMQGSLTWPFFVRLREDLRDTII